MRRLTSLFLPLGAVFLSGCTAQNSASSPLRSLAASVVTARAYDRLVLSARRGDMAAFQAAKTDLERSQDVLSNGSSSWGLSDSLNSAGYLLAETGKTTADFERAVKLTKEALQAADRAIALLDKADPKFPDYRFLRASGPRDSYAWALFKLGRFQEARQQGELALREMKQSGSKLPISADIPFHLAEIYRALGETDRARLQYTETFKLKPDADLKAKIEAGLQKLSD